MGSGRISLRVVEVTGFRSKAIFGGDGNKPTCGVAKAKGRLRQAAGNQRSNPPTCRGGLCQVPPLTRFNHDQKSSSQGARRAAWEASSLREVTPSLAKMCSRWVLTVERPIRSRVAISGLVRPSATSATTCSSVGVRLAHP